MRKKIYSLLEQYLNKLVGEMKKGKYFSYDFVSEFTLPHCSKVSHIIPISPAEITWAEKIFKIYSGETRNCDDILTLLLDHLKDNGYITHYTYIAGPYRIDDKNKADKFCMTKTFEELFRRHPALGAKTGKWDKHYVNSYILEKQFIDINGFFLGVGMWEITISTDACDVNYELFDGFELFIDSENKEAFMSKDGEEPKKISGQKKLTPELLDVLDFLSENNSRVLDCEQAISLLGDTSFQPIKNEATIDALDLFVRNLKHLLSRKFNIKDFDLYFIYKDRKLTFLHPIKRKLFCSRRKTRKK